MQRNEESLWVPSRMAELDPAWKPDFAHGRQLLDARLATRRRSLPWPALAAAAAVCAAILAVPQTRVWAQQLWVHYFLNRVDVVRVDFSDLPIRAHVAASAPMQTARDVDDAERKSGFRPALPEPGVLTADPSLTVMSAMTAELIIRVSELQAALDRNGARDVRVPVGWEGVPLRGNIGPIVSLSYPGGINILEAKPIEMSMPAGFPLQLFAEMAFRSIGRSAADALSLAQKFVRDPAWLIGIPADEVADVESIELRHGPAILVAESKDDGSPGRVTVLRSTTERTYAVVANSRQEALRIANGLQ